jgi:glucose/mannose transport system substrate-binding protein
MLRKLLTASALAIAVSIAGHSPSTAQETKEAPIEVIHWMLGPSEAAALKGGIAAFEADGGKWVDTGIAPSTLARQVMTQRLLSGDPPGAFMFVSKKDAQEFMRSGLLGDVTDVAKEEHWAEVLPPLTLDVISLDGVFYAVPIEFQMTNVFWYNKKTFADLGIGEPRNWDDVIAALGKAKEKPDIVPLAFQSEDAHFRNFWNTVLAAKGGAGLYNKIYKDLDVEAVKSPEFRAVAEAFKSLKPFTDPGAASRKWNEAVGMVISAKSAATFNGTWAKGEFTLANKVAGEDFGCVVIGETPIVNTAMFAFPKLSDPAKTAAQKHLARVFMDPKVQADFAATKGGLPPNSQADTSKFDACGKPFSATLKEHPDNVVLDSQLTIDGSTMAALIDLAIQYWGDTITLDQFIDKFGNQLSKAQAL